MKTNQRPSRKVTQATLRSHMKADMLLGWERYQAELPRLIMRHSAGKVSAETIGTAENLAVAQEIEQEREQLRKLAYACLATTEVPESSAFPDGPKKLTGTLHRLLWETPAKTKEKEKALFAAIDAHMEPFYRACWALGLEFLRDSEGLWLDLFLWTTVAKNGNRATQHLMEEIFKAVLWSGGGRPELPPEEKEAIIADCKIWQPICKELNKAFKALWNIKKYQTSGLYKKEKMGELVEKYRISIADVKAIESYLGGPPPISKKSTPTLALCHIVARKYMDAWNRFIGYKTVEKIWNEYTRDHPEWGKKRKKPLTTPVAEKTA